MASRVYLFASLVASFFTIPAAAQHLQGRIDAPSAIHAWIVLQQERGSSFIPLDSVMTSANGEFNFPQTFTETGFYRLALNDSTQVDIILNAQEPLVDLVFDSIPLQDHMKVLGSGENKRFREYNHVAKETQAVRVAVAEQRLKLQPTDTTALAQLQNAEQRAMDMQANYMDQLLTDAPDSYFAKVLRVDKALANVRGQGPQAVVAACNFSDPQLLRASVYDRAVMAYLQNLNIMDERQFAAGSDSLVALASGNPDCRTYMLERLVDLFATYGPQSALEHVISRYITPLGDSASIPPRLKTKVDALMQVAVGHTAPDIRLNDHGKMVPLSELVKANSYTAIFFYSSTCEHCHAQMPAMKADRRNYLSMGFDVIGIALDVDSVDFLKSIQENDIPWKCLSEFNGWGARSAKAFMVSATPTLFLLDSRMKIIAKPTDADELGKALREIYK